MSSEHTIQKARLDPKISPIIIRLLNELVAREVITEEQANKIIGY